MRKVFVFLLAISTLAAVSLYILHIMSSKHQAEKAVHEFYTYEQDGAFSDSWAMFHPLMQEKFSKSHYLQDRPHVFMNHFGVTTFTYTIDDVEEVKNWKLEEDAEALDTVYRVQVSQLFKGKYGKFSIVQDVYVTALEGEWRLMWDYNL